MMIIPGQVRMLPLKARKSTKISAKGTAPTDVGASLRVAQAGFALAIVLVLVWAWISFRRGGEGR